VTKTPFLNVIGLLTRLDPQARFFSHDKIEGVAQLAGGRHIVLNNDRDFGIDGLMQDSTTRLHCTPKSRRPARNRTTANSSPSTCPSCRRQPAQRRSSSTSTEDSPQEGGPLAGRLFRTS
jgi:hypothetical protein